MCETKTSPGSNVVFVLSHDFGELFDAVHLCKGTSWNPLFLMPPRLYQVNQHGFPYRSSPYTTIADILDAIDGHAPKLVSLFSGYLFVINQLFDVSNLERLIREIQGRNIPLLTSDPFLGLISSLDQETFSTAHPLAPAMRRHFGKVFSLLKSVTHFYFSGSIHPKNVHRVSFFSERNILSENDVRSEREKASRLIPIDTSKEQWTFVLSAEDYAYQMALIGSNAFHQRVDRILKDCGSASKQPIVIAPKECLGQIGIGDPSDMIKIATCDFNSFFAVLICSQYVFYWNMFSASILARVLNRLPFFVFDRGHLAHSIAPFLATAMEHYFPNCEIDVLDFGRSLDPSELQRMASEQDRKIFQPAYEHIRNSPAPDLLPASTAGSVPAV